ncbi:MAG: hypothetical protein NTU80_13860 [Verrucomicrobia bacterium]|nr:hypothetical protein [Verrucomicrobiota bacterium]
MSREVVAWRAEDAEHAALQVGRRPVQALWPLLRPNFRTVFLAPQRRAGSGVVAWRWRGAQTPPTPAAADLAGLRRRLGHALQDLSAELDHREGVVAGVGSWELHVTMEKLVGALAQASDAQLASHAVQTENGWLIRSWGFAKPGAAEIETTSENSEAEPEDAVAPEPDPVSAIKPAEQRGWLPPLIWSVGAAVFVGGMFFAYRSGWFTPAAIREKSGGVASSAIQSTASFKSAPAANPSAPESSSRSTPGGVGGVIGLKPIRAELGLPASPPLSLTSGLTPTTQAGSAAADLLAPAVIPGATVGGMRGGPDAAEAQAGPAGTPAGADEPGSPSSEKKGAEPQDTPAEASEARTGKGNDAQTGNKPEASPNPDAKSPSPDSSKPQSQSPGKTASETAVPPAATKSAAKPEIAARHAASAAKPSGMPPAGATKEVKDGAASSEETKEETRTTVVVHANERKTPTPASQPATAEKPKTPAERNRKPEKTTASREEEKTPEPPTSAPSVPENLSRVRAQPEAPEGQPTPVKKEKPEASSPSLPQPENSTAQTMIENEGERTSDASAVRAAGGAELAPARSQAGEARSWAYHIGGWQLRRVRDVVLATAPRPEGDSAAAAALAAARSRAWEEARRRVPAIFESPKTRSGWSFELSPTAWPASWVLSGGGAGVTTVAERAGEAQIQWPDLLPIDALEARLVRADGGEIARLTISVLERTIRIKGSAELIRAVPVFSIQEAESGSATGKTPDGAALAWRSLERTRWSDTSWITEREGRSLGVRCVPQAGTAPAVNGGTLGVVDNASGWALSVTIRAE